MKYQTAHIKKLQFELNGRYNRLLDAMAMQNMGGTTLIKGTDIRIAVNDFKNILKEIQRLK